MNIQFAARRLDDRSLYAIFSKALAEGNVELKQQQAKDNLTGLNSRLNVDYQTQLPWVFTSDDLSVLHMPRWQEYKQRLDGMAEVLLNE